MSETILRVENLHKVYGNKGSITNALKGISFTVEKGEYISIMGASEKPHCSTVYLRLIKRRQERYT